MISELKIRNFKSLESVDLKLGHFNLLVGANASGKSNFLDALRFLQGVGNGFSIEGILNGIPQTTTSVKWDGIRGGFRFVAFRRKDGSQSGANEIQVTLDSVGIINYDGGKLTYSLAWSVTNGAISISSESIKSDAGRVIIDETMPYLVPLPVEDFDEFRDLVEPVIDLTPHAANIFEAWPRISFWSHSEYPSELATKCAKSVSSKLADMQFLDVLPAELRTYSSKVARMGEFGEGFAALIREIDSNGSKPALLEWLKELRPDEVDDIYALEGLNNDFMVAIKEGNEEFRAPTLSEGTLRFIALAAAFFQPSMPKVLVIEEMEKGLHPSRLRLLLDLMRSQSKRTGTQVFATTHSPTLLAWLTEEDRKTTFVCARDAESGATKMRSLAEVPRLEELVKEHYNLDQLFEQGWIESVLHES
jgi:energy-coupling factor transporter ATP-binding protein EcfA2